MPTERALTALSRKGFWSSFCSSSAPWPACIKTTLRKTGGRRVALLEFCGCHKAQERC